MRAAVVKEDGGAAVGEGAGVSSISACAAAFPRDEQFSRPIVLSRSATSAAASLCARRVTKLLQSPQSLGELSK
jgi:hypothetical protein